MTPGRSAVRAVIGAAALLALAVPLAALATTRGGDGAAAPAKAPSFTRDVAPLVSDKCTGCHRIGGIAPFPLETAKQISAKAPLIAAAVGSRVMPPWPPGRRSPAYVGQDVRTLSASQRATIVAWARAGGRVDGPARRPKTPERPEIRAGETLLDLRMPAAYRPSAAKGVTDDYRCFLVDPKQTEDVFVTSARIEPGQTKVVHHVILFRTSASQIGEARALDDASPGPGW